MKGRDPKSSRKFIGGEERTVRDRVMGLSRRGDPLG